VTVHYDPSDPGEAVLDATVPPDAIVWSLLGAAGLMWALRRTRRRLVNPLATGLEH
jgi:hypothetical protein